MVLTGQPDQLNQISPDHENLFLKKQGQAWKDGPMLRGAHCLAGGPVWLPVLKSGGSPAPVTLAPGGPMAVASVGIHTHVHRPTHVCIIKNNKINLERKKHKPQGRQLLRNDTQGKLLASTHLCTQVHTCIYICTFTYIHLKLRNLCSPLSNLKCQYAQFQCVNRRVLLECWYFA